YDAARLLYLRAGWLKNEGERNTRETSMAKWYATDMSVQAALEAVQIHGAYGFSDEYPVERYLRNSKGSVIYEGTSEIHQLMQADYALGYREDRPLRCELPAYDPELWQSEAEAIGNENLIPASFATAKTRRREGGGALKSPPGRKDAGRR